MKLRRFQGYLMLMLAVAVAGCICFSGAAPSSKHAGASPSVSVPSGPLATGLMPGPASQTPTPPAPFDMARARWVEYRVAGLSDGQPYSCTEKLEYGSSSANGAQTQTIKRSITSDDAPPVNGQSAGGLFNYRVSSSQSGASSGSLAPFDQIKNDDPILCADRITGGSAGTESITVPKGTYDCKKYTGSYGGSGSTYWGAPGVPVPIKIYTACDGTTFELMDWG